jgi:hypothetical protein
MYTILASIGCGPHVSSSTDRYENENFGCWQCEASHAGLVAALSSRLQREFRPYILATT